MSFCLFSACLILVYHFVTWFFLCLRYFDKYCQGASSSAQTGLHQKQVRVLFYPCCLPFGSSFALQTAQCARTAHAERFRPPAPSGQGNLSQSVASTSLSSFFSLRNSYWSSPLDLSGMLCTSPLSSRSRENCKSTRKYTRKAKVCYTHHTDNVEERNQQHIMLTFWLPQVCYDDCSHKTRIWLEVDWEILTCAEVTQINSTVPHGGRLSWIRQLLENRLKIKQLFCRNTVS